jgi:L-lactate dehydrogenase (cytochrome)
VATLQSRRLSKIQNYEDARRAARWVLPRAIYDYVDGGSEDELTRRRNTAAFEELNFRPRMGVWVDEPKLSTTLFGQTIGFPVLTAPCGGMRLVHPEADKGVARAAADAGTLHVASSVSGYSLEEIAEDSPAGHWFQLYRFRSRPGMENLVHRAQAAGYKAMVATVDTQTGSKRERDRRNGYGPSMRVNLSNAVRLGPQLATRPFWLARYMADGLPFSVANTAGMTRDGVALPLSAVGTAESNSPTWEEIAWIRANWKGPLLAKGVLTAEDCRRALDLGCDGVVVSNHGGRQLDSTQATIEVLPEIVAAVGDQMEVILDSGVRRGKDVVKALALGAKAVLIGRYYVWGLALGGQVGVAHMLGQMRAEVRNTLQLMGCPSVQDLDPSWVTGPARSGPFSQQAIASGDGQLA